MGSTTAAGKDTESDLISRAQQALSAFERPNLARRLDWNRIDILLQPRLGDAWETPLVGLNQVRPGHFVEFGNSTLRERRFWSLTSMPHEDDYPTTVEKVRALLKSSVDGATADFESGLAMLSGGIDSTAVAALAGSRVADSFCLRFAGERDDFSASELRPDIDAPFAIEAATWLGMHHHEVELDTDDILSAIPATRRARDLPGWGQFDASMYSLFETMSGYGAQGLSGEAADELFGGYPFFFDDAAISRANFPWLGLGLRLADFVHPEARARSNDALDADQRYCRLLANVPRLADESDAAARMRELFYLGLQGPLNIVLERKDRMSAACGLDLRLPFCDHRLVDGGTTSRTASLSRPLIPRCDLNCHGTFQT